MRLLPEDEANAILGKVRQLFNDKAKCPFLFEDDKDVRIISGTEGETYSWIAVNFLAGVFDSNQKSYGSLDLEGASHQNSWDFKNGKNPEISLIKVAGRYYSVFSRSYLGYGQDQARERYMEFIAQKAKCAENPTSVVKSPCHNKGFKESLKFDNQYHIFEGTSQDKVCKQIINELFFCQSRDCKNVLSLTNPSYKANLTECRLCITS